MPGIPSKDALREIAVAALVAVANDPESPSAARAAAARTLLESLGDIGRLQELARTSAKPLAELTAEEIDAEISRLQPVASKARRR